jgi:hypothetical protein
MLFSGTEVRVNREGATLPVDLIQPGQALRNPLSDETVEVVRILRRRLGTLGSIPPGLRPHLLPVDALAPGQPTRPLRVPLLLQCLSSVRSPTGLMALEARTLRDLNVPLAPCHPLNATTEVFLLLPRLPTMIEVGGLIVWLEHSGGDIMRRDRRTM